MTLMLTLNSIKNKQLRKFFEHSIYIIIIVGLIPIYLYFELCIVLPALEEQWSFAFFCHLFMVAFLLVNIVGNLIYGMFTDSTIRGVILECYRKDNWTLCSVCECLRPPRAWHCTYCDICILKRDHHCSFLACCVGYFNQRYFLFLTFYIFVAMVYGLYYNIKFLSMFISWNNGLIIAKFVFPFAAIFIEFNAETVYVFLVVINAIIASFAGILFFFHINNILKGRVVHEISTDTKNFIYNRGWKLNIIEVFGEHWYLTWLSPFIHSRLPGNGIEWHNESKYK